MWALISGVIRWIAHKGMVFGFILALLVGIAWARTELVSADALATTVKTLTTALHDGERAIDGLKIAVETKRTEAKKLQTLLDREMRSLAAYRQSIVGEVSRRQEELAALKENNPVKVRIPGTEAWKSASSLELLVKNLQAVVVKHDGLIGSLRADPRWRRIEQINEEAQELAGQISTLAANVDKLRGQVLQKRGEYERILVKKETFDRFSTAVEAHVWEAFVLLVLVTITPSLIRVLLYFVVAPGAARARPIQLLPDSSGSFAVPERADRARATDRPSSVSLSIQLPENSELLVRPDYLQSTPTAGVKATKWLLNTRLPISSLLSGMVQLTRVFGTGDRPIVISGMSDPLVELAMVELPVTSAMACLPRALVGVIKKRDQEVAITRHWRLTSLHAWTTLQFRYLVFHGPSTLILKGCRGVRIETADGGRAIGQAATLGFSANLAYSNIRCETFVPYWRGQQELFLDRFAGARGFYVYEEVPSAMARTGLGSRHLEGAVDAFMKAFGL
jgi:hypothetical protein